MTTILLHAIGLDAGSWKTTNIPGAVPMDMQGFGDQPLPASGKLSEPEMADDIVRRAPEGPLDIVGVSMGGQVAMLIGLRHPDRVRSLVIANTGPAANPDVMHQRAAAVRADLEGQIKVTLERWFTEDALANDHPAVQYARDRLRRDDPEAFAAGWDAIAGHNVKDRLGELRMPVTVVAGTVDKAGAVDHVREIHEGIPGSRFVVLEGPHILYMEFPDRFRAAVQEHLEWVSKR